MTMPVGQPGGAPGAGPLALHEPGARYACDLHLARCAPIADALGGLDWLRPLVWFHDFGLLPLTDGCQLRVGVAVTGGAAAGAAIKALVAAVFAPGRGAVASQEFPLAPYVDRGRDASRAIQLCEDGGRYRFVLGTARAPLAAADRQRLRTWCRAIEAWAALVSIGVLPEGAGALTDVDVEEATADQDEQLVIIDEQGPPAP